MSLEASMFVVLCAVVVLLTLAMSGLLRKINLLEAAVLTGVKEAPGAASEIRPKWLGMRVPELAELAPGRPAVLLFLGANCRTCERIVAKAPEITRRLHLAGVEAVFLFRESMEPPFGFGEGADVRVGAASLFDFVGVRATPHLMAVDESGVVTASDAIGAIEALYSYMDSRQVVDLIENVQAS